MNRTRVHRIQRETKKWARNWTTTHNEATFNKDQDFCIDGEVRRVALLFSSSSL